MPENESPKEKPQDGLALIIGGLFVLALVFAAYNYFKQGKDNTLSTNNMITEQAVYDEEKGDLNGDGAKDEKLSTDKTQEMSTDTKVKDEKATAIQEVKGSQTTNTGTVWTANNYEKGEITGASYTVKSGDTLWEIAEGAYGDGSQWTKILEANNANIGRLANGTQALIVTGQILVLP